MQLWALLWYHIVLEIQSASQRIVGGSNGDISKYPFMVALMDCHPSQSDKKGLECEFFCSGTLISGNVVMTAGHCLESVSNRPGKTIRKVPIERMRVMLGAIDVNSGGERLVKVKDFVNKGFGRSIRFVKDNDIGLVFLHECLVRNPGHVDFAPIWTDAAPLCGSEVEVLGYGEGSNLDRAVGEITDPILRIGKQSVHAAQVCHNAYMHAFYDPNAKNFDDPIAQEHITNVLADTVISDTCLCASGPAAILFGDSGGPALIKTASGGHALVAVSSFGKTRTKYKFCGANVDFYQRLSGHLEWIKDQLIDNSCWAAADSFDQWPLPEHETSVKFKATRCAKDDHWQCASGQCVSSFVRCDGRVDCKDGSDELYCHDDFDQKITRQGGSSTRSGPVKRLMRIKRDDGPCIISTQILNNFLSDPQATPFDPSTDDHDVSHLANDCRTIARCMIDEHDTKYDYKKICDGLEAYMQFQSDRKLFKEYIRSRFANECMLPPDLDPNNFRQARKEDDGKKSLLVSLSVLACILMALVVIVGVI